MVIDCNPITNVDDHRLDFEYHKTVYFRTKIEVIECQKWAEINFIDGTWFTTDPMFTLIKSNKIWTTYFIFQNKEDELLFHLTWQEYIHY